MEKRAATRGEEYVPPPPKEEDKEKEAPLAKETTTKPCTDATASSSSSMETVGLKLKKELDAILKDEGLRAKERRSQKRKAEAIAAEEAGCSVEDMQKWYEENQELLEKLEKEADSKNKSKTTKDGSDQPKNKIPLVVFVGQLSYATTRDGLFQHIKKELGSEHKINQETVKVRLLSDSKTKKSRGMAFVELGDPELMYACLKLHKSLLEGRRINVERSAGGRNKETRNSKIKQFREKQEEYLSNVMDSILADYIKSGELQEGELDEGAISLCKRHTATMVEAALKEYIEGNGRSMDNTSAYFSFLLGKIAEDHEAGTFSPSDGNGGNDKGKRDNSNSKFPPKKKPKTVASKSSLPGVDFSLSEDKSDANSNPLSKIFPSMARGRGRGRGYM